MKSKQKYLIIIGLVVIVLVYAIICGYSNSTVTTSVIKTEIPADDSLMLRSIQLSNDSSTLSRKTTTVVTDNGLTTTKTRNYSVSFWYMSKKIGGGRYIPWYKPVTYSADVFYKWSSKINVHQNDTVIQGNTLLKINGKMTVTGLLSATNVKRKVEKLMEQTINQEIIKDIDAKTKNLSTDKNEK